MSNYIGHPHTRTVPDPNDRTPNDPAILIEARHVRAFVQHTVAGMVKDKALAYLPGLPALSDVELDFPTPASREKMVDWYVIYATTVMGWPFAVRLGQSVLLTSAPVAAKVQQMEWRSAPNGQH